MSSHGNELRNLAFAAGGAHQIAPGAAIARDPICAVLGGQNRARGPDGHEQSHAPAVLAASHGVERVRRSSISRRPVEAVQRHQDTPHTRRGFGADGDQIGVARDGDSVRQAEQAIACGQGVARRPAIPGLGNLVDGPYYLSFLREKGKLQLQWTKNVCLLAAIGDIVVVMNAIETAGIVDAQPQLRLDEPLPIAEQSRVRVIILVPEADDIPEPAWAKAASANPAFDFLNDAAEDVYTAANGRPFHDEG